MNRSLLRGMIGVALWIVASFGALPAPAFAQDAGGGVAANDTVESAPVPAAGAAAPADTIAPTDSIAPADTIAPAVTPGDAPADEPVSADTTAPADNTAPASPRAVVESVTPPGRAARAPKSSRVVYTTPGDVPLPAAKFAGMREALVFNHFPNPVSALIDPGQPGLNFWKHNTAVLSETEDVTLEEAGSYIYYNDQWNLRVTFTPEEFAEAFACSGAVLKAGQPYTWAQNWRTDQRLYGGWACYYAIGTTARGERVYGTGPLETTGHYYYGEEPWAVVADSSSAGWTGAAEFSSFTIDGTIAIVSGSVAVKGFEVLRGEIIFDMTSIASGVDGVAAHLMNADFFETETYPYAVFRLTEPVPLSQDGGVARGELTLKGVTKPVEVAFDRLAMASAAGDENADQAGERAGGAGDTPAARMIARGETTFDRTDFGVTFGSATFFPDAGEHAVADDVVFRFDLVLEKMAADE